jgi:2-haloacid dehalogenase
MTGSIEVVAFDVNETLFSLDRLGPAFAAAGIDEGAVPLWFARILRDGSGLAVHGQFAPFAEIALAQLRALRPEISDQRVADVVATFHQLDPYPDVAPALRWLRDAGVRAVTLTNGSADWAATLLARAGLSSYVVHNISVDAVRRWKPAPEVYGHAATVTGTIPDRVALVSAHAHDCDAARRAGLRSGRVDRMGVPAAGYFLAPDVQARTLIEVVALLVGRDVGR